MYIAILDGHFKQTKLEEKNENKENDDKVKFNYAFN